MYAVTKTQYEQMLSPKVSRVYPTDKNTVALLENPPNDADLKRLHSLIENTEVLFVRGGIQSPEPVFNLDAFERTLVAIREAATGELGLMSTARVYLLAEGARHKGMDPKAIELGGYVLESQEGACLWDKSQMTQLVTGAVEFASKGQVDLYCLGSWPFFNFPAPASRVNLPEGGVATYLDPVADKGRFLDSVWAILGLPAQYREDLLQLVFKVASSCVHRIDLGRPADRLAFRKACNALGVDWCNADVIEMLLTEKAPEPEIPPALSGVIRALLEPIPEGSRTVSELPAKRAADGEVKASSPSDMDVDSAKIDLAVYYELEDLKSGHSLRSTRIEELHGFLVAMFLERCKEQTAILSRADATDAERKAATKAIKALAGVMPFPKEYFCADPDTKTPAIANGDYHPYPNPLWQSLEVANRHGKFQVGRNALLQATMYLVSLDTNADFCAFVLATLRAFPEKPLRVFECASFVGDDGKLRIDNNWGIGKLRPDWAPIDGYVARPVHKEDGTVGIDTVVGFNALGRGWELFQAMLHPNAEAPVRVFLGMAPEERLYADGVIDTAAVRGMIRRLLLRLFASF